METGTVGELCEGGHGCDVWGSGGGIRLPPKLEQRGTLQSSQVSREIQIFTDVGQETTAVPTPVAGLYLRVRRGKSVRESHRDPNDRPSVTLHYHVPLSAVKESTTWAGTHRFPPPQLEARLAPRDPLGNLQTEHLEDNLNLPSHPSHFGCYGGVPQEPPLCETTEGPWRGPPSTTSKQVARRIGSNQKSQMGVSLWVPR